MVQPRESPRLLPTLSPVTSSLAEIASALNTPDGVPLLIPSDRYRDHFPDNGIAAYNFDEWLATRVS